MRQEAAAVEDPATNTLVFETEEIKSISLNCLKNLLSNRKPSEGVENEP